MNPRDIRSLDVAMLRTFDALLRERSVSRAARRLFLSQPAVSASLARLRDVFGDVLFTRTAHGVEPTPRALALGPQVERVLADIAALLDGAQTFDPASAQRIFRIAGSDHASALVLAPLTQELAQLGSPVRIAWEPPATDRPVAQRLADGALDLAVLARIQRPTDMATEVLYQDHYVWAVRRGHPLAGAAPTLDDFCATPQVFLGYGSSTLDDQIDAQLAREGRRRQAQLAVNGFGQVVHQLLHSDHAAVLGRRVAQAHADVLALWPLPFALPPYQSLLCWSARHAADPGVAWLRERVGAIVRAAATGGAA